VGGEQCVKDGGFKPSRPQPFSEPGCIPDTLRFSGRSCRCLIAADVKFCGDVELDSSRARCLGNLASRIRLTTEHRHLTAIVLASVSVAWVAVGGAAKG